MIGPQDIASILPTLVPILDQQIEMLVELEDHWYSMHETEDFEMNSLGARFSLRSFINPNYGNQSIDGGAFREAGQNGYLQAIVPFAADNYSGGATGAAQANLASPRAFGDSMEELVALGVEYIKRQRDIDLAHGTFPLGFRAKVKSITSNATSGSVVVMDDEEGNRFLDENGFYIACHPTTGAAHGVTTGHQVTTKTDNQITNFSGDVGAGTTWAAGDFLVNRADAEGASSFNKAMYGFEYFGLDSGEYLGLSKDTNSKLRGLRENGNGNNISRSLLLRGETRYKYRWNPGMEGRTKLTAMIDAVPTAQYAAYEAMGYNLVQYLAQPGEAIKNFDAKINAVRDGSRVMIENANIRPSNWFRYDKSTIKRGVFEKTALWTRDGQKYRSIYSSGVGAASGVAATAAQIKDLTSFVIQGKENTVCKDPAKIIWYFNIGVNGVYNGVAS
jgi:hypothetical protein